MIALARLYVDGDGVHLQSQPGCLPAEISEFFVDTLESHGRREDVLIFDKRS